MAELEQYLRANYEQLEEEESVAARLLREGLFRFIQICERMCDLIYGGELEELGDWKLSAYEANQLLLQGLQEIRQSAPQ